MFTEIYWTDFLAPTVHDLKEHKKRRELSGRTCQQTGCAAQPRLACWHVVVVWCGVVRGKCGVQESLEVRHVGLSVVEEKVHSEPRGVWLTGKNKRHARDSNPRPQRTKRKHNTDARTTKLPEL